MTQHPDWDALNALVDDTVADEKVRSHVAKCAECSRTATALEQLAHDARAMAVSPHSTGASSLSATARVASTPTAPTTLSSSDTDALWRDITNTIAPPATLERAPSRRISWRVLATAASIAIVSSGTTWYFMRTPIPTAVTATAVMPVAFQRTEATYLDNVAQLRGDLNRLRDQLDPRTVAAVERSLDVIDAAIAEVRDALLADPANAAVSELLASHYRQKIELLRRATQLTPAA